jgi:hypothetical protein
VKKLVKWELGEETEVFSENQPQSHVARHKPYMTSPGIKARPPLWETAV